MADATSLSFTNFGDLLKHLRQRARMTQDEFGLAVGYSRAHVARLERNQRAPDPAAVKARFVEALYLQVDATLAARLIELAVAAHAKAPAAAAPAQQPPNNLPLQLTSFIGRERELAELNRLLPATRLLTLTGAGGTGKTRLALQLAAEVMDTYPEGVWLVELAPLSDPALVPQTVAAALSVREEPGRPILATLVDALRLRDKQRLLLLDNCEHLIEACARLADAVLRSDHNTRILATSREALGVAGELAWRVPSLQTPDPGRRIVAADLARYEACSLFVGRAAFASPAFTVSDDNAAAIAQVCHRLDGIPLAIELAAARVRTLMVQDIAARLDNRFRLLTGGSRTALPRQRTLRGAVDWSYDLLSEPERMLLRRLSVFAGGWTLEAAESVCAGDGIEPSDVLDVLASLVDKSLAMVDESGAGTRYALLETIRQYGLEKLADTAEVAWVRDRHLDYFVKLGEAVAPQLEGAAPADQVSLVKRLACDLDNVRRALDWATETGRVGDGLRLAHALSIMFIVRAGQGEMLARLKPMLAQPVLPQDTRARAWALLDIVNLHERQAEFDLAGAALDQAQAIGLALADPKIQSRVSYFLALDAHLRGDYALARSHFEKRRASVIAGNLLDENAQKAEETFFLGALALSESDYPLARHLLAQSYALTFGVAEVDTWTAIARHLGYALLYQGDLAEAAVKLRASLGGNLALGDKQAVAACLAAFAALAMLRDDLSQAARLFGASEAISQSIHTPLMSSDVEQVRRNVAALRARLDEVTLNAGWAAGRAMTLEQAVDDALACYGKQNR